MTRLEFIQSCSKEELADFLCNMYDGVITFHCGLCVANEHCQQGERGFLHWLEEEVDE